MRLSLVGWFGDLDEMYEHRDVLPFLRDAFGLNVIIPESHLWHTSGFTVSPGVEAVNPLKDWRRQPGLGEHRIRFNLPEDAFAVLPGVTAGADDTRLLTLLETCHEHGIAVWGHFGLWSYGGEVFPEYAMRDADGQMPAERFRKWGVGFCPSKPELMRWLEACLEEVLARYEVDGLFLDHARYPAPASFDSLFGCACDDCLKVAALEGHRLKRPPSVGAVRSALHAADEGHLARLLAQSDGLPRFFAMLTGDDAVHDWFQARCDVLTHAVERLRRVAKQVRGEDFPFGVDVFPPSVAYMGGHDSRTFHRAVGYVTGGHGSVVGWGTTAMNTATSWTRELRSYAEGFDEARTLETILRWLRLGGLNPREEREGVEQASFSSKVLDSEYRRAAQEWAGRVELYAPLSASESDEAIERSCKVLAGCGYKGVIMSGIRPRDEQRHGALRKALTQLPLPKNVWSAGREQA